MASLVHLQTKLRAISASPNGPLLTAVMTCFQAIWHSSHQKKQKVSQGAGTRNKLKTARWIHDLMVIHPPGAVVINHCWAKGIFLIGCLICWSRRPNLTTLAPPFLRHPGPAEGILG